MKIAFITYEYPPYCGSGGLGTYAFNIARELKLLGHTVVIFTPNINRKKINHIEQEDNLTIIPIEIEEKLPFKAAIFWYKLDKYVKKYNVLFNFDIIHVNGISYWFLRKKILPIPHVITIHHVAKSAHIFNNYNFINRLLDIGGENGFIIPSIEKRALYFNNNVITVSNFTKNEITKFYDINKNNIYVIYNGINFNNRSSNEEILQFKKQHKLEDKHVILFVGRFSDKRKGFHTLLKSFNILLNRINAYLLIVGDGDKTESMEIIKNLGIEEKVNFMGFVDELTLAKCYQASDVLVCPSKFEGFGLSIIEAMYYGKPVVAFNVGAIPEILIDTKNGYLVEAEDIINMADSIYTLLYNKKLAIDIGMYNIEYVEKSFNWKISAKSIEEVYKITLSENNAKKQ